MEKIAVLGAGVMGTALAIHMAKNNYEINLWGTRFDTKTIDEYKKNKKCINLDTTIPDNVSFYFENELESAVKETNLIVLAVTSDGVRDISASISSYIGNDTVIANIAKGIEKETLLTMSEIISSTLCELGKKNPVVKIGGPLRAIELANEVPSEGIFASSDISAATLLANIFKTSYFKSSVTNDIIGVEICSALKNTYAIAVGICEGLYPGKDNPKSALIARSSIELSKLVKAKGGYFETALGLAGIGDLYVTSQGGRNKTLGILLGKGNNLREAIEIMKNQTIEGYQAAETGYELARKLEKDGQISSEDFRLLHQLYNILYCDKKASIAIQDYWNS